MEAWTAEISSDLDLEMSDLSFREERGGPWWSGSNYGTRVEARAMLEGLRLHKSIDSGPIHHFWWFFWPKGVSVATR